MNIKQLIRSIVTHTWLYPLYTLFVVKRRQIKELKKWEDSERSTPTPHIIKQKTLQAYANKYNLKILVESGTYYGDMVEAMKRVFNQIYSIELSKDLYNKAKQRFKRYKYIEIICGDSGKELKNIIAKIDQPALFWLDGHYSGGVTAKGEKETPIYEELRHIFSKKNMKHIIIIDDARCFGKEPDYPTIENLNKFFYSMQNNVEVAIEDDMIRITPKLGLLE